MLHWSELNCRITFLYTITFLIDISWAILWIRRDWISCQWNSPVNGITIGQSASNLNHLKNGGLLSSIHHEAILTALQLRMPSSRPARQARAAEPKQLRCDRTFWDDWSRNNGELEAAKKRGTWLTTVILRTGELTTDWLLVWCKHPLLGGKYERCPLRPWFHHAVIVTVRPWWNFAEHRCLFSTKSDVKQAGHDFRGVSHQNSWSYRHHEISSCNCTSDPDNTVSGRQDVSMTLMGRCHWRQNCCVFLFIFSSKSIPFSKMAGGIGKTIILKTFGNSIFPSNFWRSPRLYGATAFFFCLWTEWSRFLESMTAPGPGW